MSQTSEPLESLGDPQELSQEQLNQQQKKNEKLKKENEKLQKKINKNLQKNADAEFIKKLKNAEKEGIDVKDIWNESTNEQRRRVLVESKLNKKLLEKINKNRTELEDFISKLNSLNTNMRNEINDVFSEIPGDENNSEKIKKAWKKHKPFIVKSKGEVQEVNGDLEIKVRKCALNFGAHRCVYHFLPFDKKNLFITEMVQL
jgi:cell division protein FtsB